MSAVPVPQICGHCRYYFQYRKHEDNGEITSYPRGQCRANPPVPVVLREGERRPDGEVAQAADVQAVFPVVEEDCCCGEWTETRRPGPGPSVVPFNPTG